MRFGPSRTRRGHIKTILGKAGGRSIVMSNDCFKRQKGAMIGRYTKSDDIKGLKQVLTTFVPFTLLWWAAVRSAAISPWLATVPLLPIILLTVRVFGLMHECGHGSLFSSRRLNRVVGFLLGVDCICTEPD